MLKGHLRDFRGAAAAGPGHLGCVRHAQRLGRGVIEQPGKTNARGSAHGFEFAPEQNPAVRLHRHATDGAVRVGIEARVERAVGIQPRDVLARDPAHPEEFAPDQNLAVRLHHHAIDDVAVHIGIEAHVDRAVGVDPG